MGGVLILIVNTMTRAKSQPRAPIRIITARQGGIIFAVFYRNPVLVIYFESAGGNGWELVQDQCALGSSRLWVQWHYLTKFPLALFSGLLHGWFLLLLFYSHFSFRLFIVCMIWVTWVVWIMFWRHIVGVPLVTVLLFRFLNRMLRIASTFHVMTFACYHIDIHCSYTSTISVMKIRQCSINNSNIAYAI